jgi:hypothetical protein
MRHKMVVSDSAMARQNAIWLYKYYTQSGMRWTVSMPEKQGGFKIMWMSLNNMKRNGESVSADYVASTKY